MTTNSKLISNYTYKKMFLPNVSRHDLFNFSSLQSYRIERYLKHIVIPVTPYQTTFNFFIFVTKGWIKQQLENSVFEVKANGAINIRQGNYTATLELSDDVEGYFVVYENEIIDKIVLNSKDLNFFYTSPFLIVKEKTISWIIGIFELLEEELRDIESNQTICILLFESILLKIIRAENKNYQALSHMSSISFHFRELVHKHHVEHKEIGFYAQKLNLSDNYLNKCVKETTGKPPKQWINEISILHSQILLQDNSLEIAQIAFELNYQSPSYFSRLFKKITGLTPTAYRSSKSS
ncbi:MAG: AraC family transcriptional regulator [Gelidibacter sp.]